MLPPYSSYNVRAHRSTVAIALMYAVIVSCVAIVRAQMHELIWQACMHALQIKIM